MNFLKTVLLMLFLALPQFAWSSPLDCKRCADIKDLENRFLALSYEKEADRKQGFDMIPQVLGHLRTFYDHQRGANATQEFRMLVHLVSAARPYEQGPESIESLASLILYPSSSTSWKAIYEETVESITDNCRQKLLRTAVKERICSMRMEARNQGRRRNSSACAQNPVFLYGQCIGMKTED